MVTKRKKIDVANKKGMSAIVTTLLIVVLVIVAIGVIWGVLKNFINKGTNNFEMGAKCIDVDVHPTKVSCDLLNKCNVTYTRTAGGEEISGIKIILTNDLGENSSVTEYASPIEPLETKTQRNINTGINDCSKASIAVYFEDESGNKNYCSPSAYYTF